MGRWKNEMMELQALEARKSRFLQEIMDIVGEDWSGSDISSDHSDQEEFCRSSPDDYSDADFSEPHSSDFTDRGQGAAAAQDVNSSEPHSSDFTDRDQGAAAVQEPSMTERRVRELRSLLEKRSEHSKFIEIISRVLVKLVQRRLHEEATVLLEFGADPNLDHTLLCVAVDNGDASMVEILIKHGAFTSDDYCDENALIVACERGNQDCVKILVEHAEHVNIENSEGRTPLLLLLEREMSLDLLELLLEKGANGCTTQLQEMLCQLVREDEKKTYGIQVVRLLLRYDFFKDCWEEDSLLTLSLEDFDELFPLAALLLEQVEPPEPNAHQVSCFEVLYEALNDRVVCCSEAEARPLVDKANELLDLPIVRPPLLRFTLIPLQNQDCAGAESVELDVGTAPASLESMCRAFIRRSLLPFPLEPKIRALPIPEIIQDLLMPRKHDG